MIRTYYDSRYGFWEVFNPDTGLYYRSDRRAPCGRVD